MLEELRCLSSSVETLTCQHCTVDLAAVCIDGWQAEHEHAQHMLCMTPQSVDTDYSPKQLLVRRAFRSGAI